MSAFTLKDRATLGALAGIAAIAVRDVFNIAIKLLGLAHHFVWNMAADLFIPTASVTTVGGNILGIIVDTSIGAVLGVIFIYLLISISRKNIIIKGFGFGLAAWLLIYGLVFHILPETKNQAPRDPAVNLIILLGHSIFGLTLGYASMKLLDLFNLPENNL